MWDAAGEVVVSGLSGRLPESDNIAEFREHLINGDDMITDDDRRWEPGERKYFLDPEGGSQKGTLVVVLLLVISSLKIPKAFLICSGAQRNFAYTFLMTFTTDVPSQIFKLISN